MEIWNETAWYLRVVFNILLVIIPALVVLVVASEGGIKVVRTAKMLFKTFCKAIDEPTDPLIALIAAKTGYKPEVVSDLLVTKVDEVIALLPGEEEQAVTAGVKELFKQTDV